MSHRRSPHIVAVARAWDSFVSANAPIIAASGIPNSYLASVDHFEDDLIPSERWKDKDAVLREIGAPILLTPIKETLAAFRTELETKFERTYERITNSNNLTSPATASRWSRFTGYFAPRKQAYDLPEMKEYLAKDANASVALSQLKYAEPTAVRSGDGGDYYRGYKLHRGRRQPDRCATQS